MATRSGHASNGFAGLRARGRAVARLEAGASRFARRRSAPVLLLAAVSLLSLGARVAWLGQPCHRPCRTPSDHSLIFDESYYVNAARVIARVHVPAGAVYAGTPVGVDPNSEHPQLAKLLMAGAISVLGDGPLAWRLGSLIFGSLAIVGLFALVGAAGGGRWTALAASTLMAADNLLLVHGRIGTLDIYVLAMMIWGTVLYLRGWRIGAGVVIGVGTAFKLVAPYALVVIALVECARALSGLRESGGGRLWPETRRRLGRMTACAASALVVFVALIAVLDAVAPPYDPAQRARITGGPLAHIAHMLSFAGAQTSPHGPTGIASYPWQWWFDYKPIVYLNVDVHHPARGLSALRPAVHFLGVVSPPILLLALPGLALAVARARRTARDIDIVGVAWCLGTFLPFELLSLLSNRTSYLYYMVVVMPGVYMVVTRLLAGRRRWVVGAWSGAVVVAAVLMYPFAPVPGL